jgi:hypothetical protein
MTREREILILLLLLQQLASGGNSDLIDYMYLPVTKKICFVKINIFQVLLQLFGRLSLTHWSKVLLWNSLASQTKRR